MVIPSPGAVCPAMVRFPSVIFKGDSRKMVPEVLKIICLGPFCFKANLKVPSEPSSVILVTVKTYPPLPPVVNFPKPSAPGKLRTP